MSREKHPRSADCKAVGILSLLVTVLFFDVLFLGNNFYGRDLSIYHYPMKFVVRAAMLSGEFPWWNPFFAAGQPLAANPAYELFYPPQWLVLLPDFHLGYRLHIAVHLYIAIIGAYLLLRSLSLRPISSFFGAVTFALSGPFLSLMNTLPFFFSYSWLPWIVIFARRAIHRRRFSDGALAAVFFSMQFLCGEPVTVAQTAIILCGMGLWHFRAPGVTAPDRPKIVLIIALIGLSAAALGAVQLLPSIGHAHDSIRSRPFPYSTVTSWSMPLIRPLEIFFPTLIGSTEREGVIFWGAALYPEHASPFIISIYLGVFAAALCTGAIASRIPRAIPLTLMTAFGFVMAWGGHTPIYRILYDTGLIRSLRYPEKLALTAVFALTLLSAIALDRLIDGDSALLRRVTWVAGAMTLVALLVAAATFAPGAAATVRRLFYFSGPPLYDSFAVNVMRGQWLAAAARSGFLLALLVWWRKRGGSRELVAAFALLLVIDLAPPMNVLAPRMPREFFTAPQLLSSFPASGRERFRLFHAGALDNEMQHKVLNEGRSYWLLRNGMFPYLPALWSIPTVFDPDIDETQLLATRDLKYSMQQVRARQREWPDIFMSMSNARYFGDFDPTAGEPDLRQRQPVRIFQTAPYPRYYFADQMHGVSSREEFIALLIGRRWSRRVAFVGFPPFEPGAGQVTRVEEGWSRSSVDVEAQSRSYLVVSISPHRRWSATIDGAAVPLHVTNIGYQGLVVPAGKHHIEFRYRDPLVIAGAWISLAALMLLAAGAALSGRRLRPDVSYTPAT
ncbi:MAG TPA: YfhO family protein [Thermoanaerobaculia bacterium]|nr:YfhO family protein [Thermoanaerobaculia bacterium]